MKKNIALARDAIVFHPGETLKTFLKEHKLTQKQFAEFIGKKQEEVNFIVKGRRDINPDRAIRIGAFFGTGPEVWIGLQSSYDIHSLWQKEKNQTTYEYIYQQGKLYKKIK